MIIPAAIGLIVTPLYLMSTSYTMIAVFFALQGAFAGSTPEESYFVICDDRVNTARTLAEGKIKLLFGIAITKPPDFHAWLITHHAGSSTCRPSWPNPPQQQQSISITGGDVEDAQPRESRSGLVGRATYALLPATRWCQRPGRLLPMEARGEAVPNVDRWRALRRMWGQLRRLQQLLREARAVASR